MGNLEKLVVVTVMFLAGVVLAVSMNSSSAVDAGGSNPAEELGLRANANGPGRGTFDSELLGDADRQGAPIQSRPTATSERLDQVQLAAFGGASRPQERPNASNASRESNPERIASADAADRTPGNPSAPAGPPLLSASAERALPEPGVLRQVDGLSATLSEHYFSYTCRDGDTWTSLARRLYGSADYVETLTVANPDKLVLAAGTQLTVPADARLDSPRSTAARPQPTRIVSERTPASTETQPARDVDGELGTEFREHTVARGETLSHIAGEYYGRAVLWRRIFDANRDVIEDPDRVPEGTVLRIP